MAQQHQQQYFTHLQTQTIDNPNKCEIIASLCPQRDLLAYTLLDTSSSAAHNSNNTNSNQTLHILRILSWQTLVSLENVEIAPITSICWSYDGDVIVLGYGNGQVKLFDMEGDEILAFETNSSYNIVAMTWQKRIQSIQFQQSDDKGKVYRKQVDYCLDKTQKSLPVWPLNDHRSGAKRAANSSQSLVTDFIHKHNGTSVSPCASSIFSILFVMNNDGDIYLYLHGRFLICIIKTQLFSAQQQQTDQYILQPTMDLATIYAGLKGGSNVRAHDLAEINMRTEELRWMSSTHSTLSSTINLVEEKLKFCSSQWKNSFRVLDTKFSMLKGLLRDYGVDDSATPRSEILNFILGGNTGSIDAVNQFFGNCVNDQSMQRMVATLESGTATVEKTLKQQIVPCGQLLHFTATELHGLVQTNNMISLGDDSSLVTYDQSLALIKSSNEFYKAAKSLLSKVTLFRYRLKILMQFFYSSIADAKAKGTAEDSIEREHARKKRPPHQVLKEIIEYLTSPTFVKAQGDIETEHILGMNIQSYLSKDETFVSTERNKKSHEASLKANISRIRKDFESIYCQMSLNFSSKVASSEIVGQGITSCCGRVGGGSERNFFTPKVKERYVQECNQWFVIVRSITASSSNYLESKRGIQLILRPCLEFDEELYTSFRQNFCLVRTIVIPNNAIIKDISFCNGEGRNVDDCEYQMDQEYIETEGRHYISILVDKQDSDLNVRNEELWVFRYDEIEFYELQGSGLFFNSENGTIDKDHEPCTLLFTDEDDDEKVSEIRVKCREISSSIHITTAQRKSKMIVNGSRARANAMACLIVDNRKFMFYDIEDDEDDDSHYNEDEEEVEEE